MPKTRGHGHGKGHAAQTSQQARTSTRLHPLPPRCPPQALSLPRPLRVPLAPLWQPTCWLTKYWSCFGQKYNPWFTAQHPPRPGTQQHPTPLHPLHRVHQVNTSSPYLFILLLDSYLSHSINYLVISYAYARACVMYGCTCECACRVYLYGYVGLCVWACVQVCVHSDGCRHVGCLCRCTCLLV